MAAARRAAFRLWMRLPLALSMFLASVAAQGYEFSTGRRGLRSVADGSPPAEAVAVHTLRTVVVGEKEPARHQWGHGQGEGASDVEENGQDPGEVEERQLEGTPGSGGRPLTVCSRDACGQIWCGERNKPHCPVGGDLVPPRELPTAHVPIQDSQVPAHTCQRDPCGQIWCGERRKPPCNVLDASEPTSETVPAVGSAEETADELPTPSEREPFTEEVPPKAELQQQPEAPGAEALDDYYPGQETAEEVPGALPAMPERGSHTSAPSPVDASQRSKPQGPELKRCVCELILAPVCDRESLREVAGNQCTALCSGFRVEDLIPCPPNLSRAGPQVEPQEPGGPTCVEEADKVGRFAALAACEAVTESCEQILQEERARPLPLCKKEEVANCEAAAFDLVQADEALAACKSQITLNDKLSGCTAEQASSIFVTMVSIVCSLVADK